MLTDQILPTRLFFIPSLYKFKPGELETSLQRVSDLDMWTVTDFIFLFYCHHKLKTFQHIELSESEEE